MVRDGGGFFVRCVGLNAIVDQRVSEVIESSNPGLRLERVSAISIEWAIPSEFDMRETEVRDLDVPVFWGHGCISGPHAMGTLNLSLRTDSDDAGLKWTLYDREWEDEEDDYGDSGFLGEGRCEKILQTDSKNEKSLFAKCQKPEKIKNRVEASGFGRGPTLGKLCAFEMYNRLAPSWELPEFALKNNRWGPRGFY